MAGMLSAIHGDNRAHLLSSFSKSPTSPRPSSVDTVLRSSKYSDVPRPRSETTTPLSNHGIVLGHRPVSLPQTHPSKYKIQHQMQSIQESSMAAEQQVSRV